MQLPLSQRKRVLERERCTHRGSEGRTGTAHTRNRIGQEPWSEMTQDWDSSVLQCLLQGSGFILRGWAAMEGAVAGEPWDWIQLLWEE